MTAPTDREAKIAAALAHLCNCYDDHMIAVRNGYSPEEVERRAERYRRAEAEATTLMREPAPDGKALRALRAWVAEFLTGDRLRDPDVRDSLGRLGDDEARRAYNTACSNHLVAITAEIDRLTGAPVADAEAEDDYKSLDHAMEILRSCVSPYTGEQAQKVAKALKQWQEKWKAAVDLIFPDERQTLADLRAMLADAEADRLAIAQQVGIVYVADHHAPVAGPTPAILRAIAKMQRDAGDADQLRSAGLSLRAENERLQAELTAARAERDAALRDVQLGTSESEVVRLALAQRDAARADQAAMARRELEWLLQAMSRWHQAVTDLTPSAGNRRGAIEDVVGTLRLRLAALPQPKPAAEPNNTTPMGGHGDPQKDIASREGGADSPPRKTTDPAVEIAGSTPASGITSTSIAAPQRGDWPEDAVYENGSYQCLCSTCGGWFTGYKSRTRCKTCYDVELDAPAAEPVPVSAALFARTTRDGLAKWRDAFAMPDETNDDAIRRLTRELSRSAAKQPAADLHAAIQKLADWIGDHWVRKDWGIEGEKLNESMDLLHGIAKLVGFDIEKGRIVKPAAEPSSNLPPLPIDDGRVRDDLADFRDWMIDNMRFVECLRIGSEHHPLGGAIQVTDYYIAEINKRLSALAGKEKP